MCPHSKALGSLQDTQRMKEPPPHRQLHWTEEGATHTGGPPPHAALGSRAWDVLEGAPRTIDSQPVPDLDNDSFKPDLIYFLK